MRKLIIFILSFMLSGCSPNRQTLSLKLAEFYPNAAIVELAIPNSDYYGLHFLVKTTNNDIYKVYVYSDLGNSINISSFLIFHNACE